MQPIFQLSLQEIESQEQKLIPENFTPLKRLKETKDCQIDLIMKRLKTT